MIRPLLVTVMQVARMLGIGRTAVYGLLDRKVIESVQIGSARRVPVDSVEAYVRSLRKGGPHDPTSTAWDGNGPAPDPLLVDSPCGPGCMTVCSDPAAHAEGGHDV